MQIFSRIQRKTKSCSAIFFWVKGNHYLTSSFFLSVVHYFPLCIKCSEPILPQRYSTFLQVYIFAGEGDTKHHQKDKLSIQFSQKSFKFFFCGIEIYSSWKLGDKAWNTFSLTLRIHILHCAYLLSAIVFNLTRFSVFKLVYNLGC